MTPHNYLLIQIGLFTAVAFSFEETLFRFEIVRFLLRLGGTISIFFLAGKLYGDRFHMSRLLCRE